MGSKSARASLESIQLAFRHLLNSGHSLSKIRDSALGNHLLPTPSNATEVPGRSIAWKLFLIPREPLDSEVKPAYLLDSLHISRKQYADLLLEKMRAPDGSYEDTFIMPGANKSPRREASNPTNLERNNPLSLHVENPWVEWFASVELRKTIHQDVERTFPDMDFFRSNEVQTQLTNILFIYSVMHPSIGYRQGMHEVLAPLYYAVDYDSVSDEEGAALPDKTIQEVCSRSWVAADAWALFHSIMSSVSRWYEWREGIPGSDDATNPLPHHVHINVPNGPLEVKPYIAPIVQACNRIQSNLLRSTDPVLWKHMQATGIEPQIYGIRWLRLLFTREFSMPDSMKLWDGLFACDPTFELTPWICVAMLIRIRNQLLPADYTGQLTVLLRYPSPQSHPDHPDPVHHASLLLRQALALQMSPNPAAGASLMMENRSLLDIPMDVPEPPPAPPRRSAQMPNSRPRSGSPLNTSSRKDAVDPLEIRRPVQQQQMGFPEMLARGLLERGESLGINKTLMSAVTEIRRNIPDLAASLVRSPSANDATFPMTDDRPPEERPPWEPRTRLEMERDIAELRRRNKLIGESLTWIVDALLQDEEQSADRDKVKAHKREALESLSYVRDVVVAEVTTTLDEEVLLGAEKYAKRKAPVSSQAKSSREPALDIPQPIAPAPASVIDTRRKGITPNSERRRSSESARQSQISTSPTSPTEDLRGAPSQRLAPWAYTRSKFSADSSSLPATTLPRPPPPTSTSLRHQPPQKAAPFSSPRPEKKLVIEAKTPHPLQDPLGVLN